MLHGAHAPLLSAVIAPPNVCGFSTGTDSLWSPFSSHRLFCVLRELPYLLCEQEGTD